MQHTQQMQFEQGQTAGASFAVPPSMPSASSVQQDRLSILIMEVLISQGKTGQITVCVGDCAEALARQFVLEHGLADAHVAKLTQHIEVEVGKLQLTTPPLRTAADYYGSSSAQAAVWNSSLPARPPFPPGVAAGDGGGSGMAGGTDSAAAAPEKQKKKKKKMMKKKKSGWKAAQLKRRRHDAAFERLNAEARAKETRHALAVKAKEIEEAEAIKRTRVPKSRLSAELHTKFHHGHYSNTGERLYETGIRAIASKVAEAERHQARMLERQETEECTFQPKIDPTSKEIALNRQRGQAGAAGTLGPCMNIHERLHADREHKENRKQLALVANAEAIEVHTFKPEIGALSQQLAEERRLAQYDAVAGSNAPGPSASGAVAAPRAAAKLSVHARLHEDAEDRHERLERFQQWSTQRFTHEPDIGIDKLRPQTDESKEAFITRLAYEHFEQQERLGTLQEKYHGNYDRATGQPLYRPRVGRGPVFDRNSSGLPIGEFLFSARHEFADARARKAKQKEDEAKGKQLAKKITKESERLIEKVRAAPCLPV